MSVACRASARASVLAACWLAHTLPARSRMTPIRFASTKRPTTWPTDGGRRSERLAAAPSTRRTHSGEESLDTDGSTIVVPSSTAVPHPLRPPWRSRHGGHGWFLPPQGPVHKGDGCPTTTDG